MESIALNARFYSHVPTGMQRYGIEMAARLGDLLEVVRPKHPLKGAKGHVWEQVYLPAVTGRRLLWSPNNTGPLAISRQVCTMHDIIPVEHPEWFNAKFAGWYQWLLPRLVKRVQHMVAVSQFTKERLVERFRVKPERISVVWNGVDAQFRPRTSEEVEQVKAEMGIRSPRYLLTVGSVEPRKNLRRLLAAWQRLTPELPEDLELVVVGLKGASLVFQDATIEHLPKRVCLAGYARQEALPALYAGALAMVYPSLYEGFGLPPLEAMACGTAVVTSNNSSLPEVVGDSALLVNALDEDSIAQGVLRIVRDSGLRDELSRKGLARAQMMSWNTTAQQTRRILEECWHG